MNAPLRETIRNVIARMWYLWAKLAKNYFCLDRRNWKWISAASLLVILLFVAGNMLFHSGSLNFWWMFVAGLIFAAIPLLYGALIKSGILIAGSIPRDASWLVFSAGALFFIYFSGPVQGLFVLLFYLLFTVIFIAGALSNISSKGWTHFPRRLKLLNIFIFCIGVSNLLVAVYFLSYPGRPQQRMPDSGLHALHLADPLALPDPGQKGPYAFSMLTYGTGNDKHRKEFGEEVDVPSRTVDGCGFLAGWDRLPGRLRTAYWGFGPEELPLNGRVWMPEGKGPFPVVLIVHGNHLDREYSDDGYAYIGEHLASHGYLAASVDENFLNRGLTDFNHSLEEENDARGWLLLKHLELIRTWDRDSSSVFFGKANTGQVILIGHSRGGEAAGIAAFFNELPYYPDDASERFDFNFGIRGIVAIAPVFGQYSPGNRPLQLSDINYLALQGSMDADLESYMGLHQFNMIRFNDSAYHFKAGLYILHANHGQFNSSWGVNDAGYPQGLLLNRKALLNAKDQQLAALVGITSFVKATIDQQEGYVQFFRDYRTGREWLPETRYISQFADNRVDVIADFEEDMNLLTTSIGDLATIYFEGLAAMFEEENELHKGMMGTKTAMIGWNNTSSGTPGSYSIHFSQPLDLVSHSYRAFQFDVAVLDRYPGERMNEPSSSEDRNKENPAGKITGKTEEQEPQAADIALAADIDEQTLKITNEQIRNNTGEQKLKNTGEQTPGISDGQELAGVELDEQKQAGQKTDELELDEQEPDELELDELELDEQEPDELELDEQEPDELELDEQNPDEQKPDETGGGVAGERDEENTGKTVEVEFDGQVEEISKDTVEKKPEKVVEKKPEKVVEKKPEKVVEKKPEKVVEKKPEKTGGEVRRSLDDENSSSQHEDSLSDASGSESYWFEMRDEDPGEVGFSIVLTDIAGNTASVAISEHFPLVFPQQAPLYKLKIFNMDEEPEPVPQHVEIDLHHFYSENPNFDKHNLASIHFVFDRASDGMISIDNIGFANFK